MKKKTHSLTNREINDINTNGLRDEYEEFANSSFDNMFVPLERPDYEIRATSNEDINKNSQEDIMKNTRKASYIGQLSSGYDATVQDDYDAGKGAKGQIGKGHEEEVAAKNNWENDKRNEIGKAASAHLRRTAARLNKLADLLDCEDVEDEELESLEDDLEEQELDADIDEDLNDEGDEISDEEYEELLESVASISGTKKSAAHPLERGDDSPKSEMSSQTGDDEWIDIGPGEFNDKRDEAGRAK